MPALLTRSVTPPSASIAAATAASTAADVDTSHSNASPSTPSTRRSSTATAAPSAMNRWQIAAPIPDAPPVTMALCPSSEPTTAILPRRYARTPMEPDDARDRLSEERDRLERVREGFEAEHLHDETEDDSTS